MIPKQRYKGTEIKILWTKNGTELGISDSSSIMKDTICAKIEELLVYYEDPLESDIQVSANSSDILTSVPACFSYMIVHYNNPLSGTLIMSFFIKI